jgi:hypothetical protein
MNTIIFFETCIIRLDKQGRSQDLTIGGAKRQCQLKIYEHNFLVIDIVIGKNKHLFIKCRSSTFTTRHIEHVN